MIAVPGDQSSCYISLLNASTLPRRVSSGTSVEASSDLQVDCILELYCRSFEDECYRELENCSVAYPKFEDELSIPVYAHMCAWMTNSIGFTASRIWIVCREIKGNGRITWRKGATILGNGSPFMNHVFAPLRYNCGTTGYFIGAQVDVSGLSKECSDLDSPRRLATAKEKGQSLNEGQMQHTLAQEPDYKKDEFQQLSEMMNMQELEAVRRRGGRMHRERAEAIQDEREVTN